MENTRHRGQIIDKGNGKWLVRIYLGRTLGKRRYLSKLVAGSYREADKVRTKLLGSADTKTLVAPSKMLLEQYLKTWLAGKVGLSVSAQVSYGQILRLYAVPAMGAMRLDQVNRLHIQSLVTTMVDRKLSSRTISYTVAILKQAFEAAVRDGMIAKNPCDHVETPKQEKHEVQALTPQETATLLSSGQDAPLYPLWALLLTSGLRPQEALALEWDDIDFTAGAVRVTKALQKVDVSGAVAVGGTKTHKSRRTVSIPMDVARILDTHRRERLRAMMEGGIASPLVFCTSTGSPLEMTAVRRQWHEALAAAGLPKVKLYATRHSHISHLLALGTHPKVAADRAGHANVTLTLNTYSHALPELDTAAATKVGALLFRKVAT